jgi:hypothetical protein
MSTFAGFSDADRRVIDATDEVQIETPRAGSKTRRTTIWIVTDGPDVFVRSVRGSDGLWFQAIRAGASGVLHAGAQSWPVTASPATDAASIARVNAALETKYGKRWRGPTDAMLRPEVFDTTLRLLPA